MKEYLDLVRLVLEQGTLKKSRTGIDTISYFGAHYKVDLAKGFPLLTTKEVNYAACLRDLLWYLSGEDNIATCASTLKSGTPGPMPTAISTRPTAATGGVSLTLSKTSVANGKFSKSIKFHSSSTSCVTNRTAAA